MSSPDKDILGAAEIQFAAEDISAAAGADELLLDSYMRDSSARKRLLGATSVQDQLAARLDEESASLAAIGAMAADSRFTWEVSTLSGESA